MQPEKGVAITTMVEVAIIKNGINQYITNMAGPGVIITSSIIARRTGSDPNTVLGVIDRSTGRVTPDATTDDPTTRWCKKLTTIIVALKVMLRLKTSSLLQPRYRTPGSHSPSG
jgi:hypothetical protein